MVCNAGRVGRGNVFDDDVAWLCRLEVGGLLGTADLGVGVVGGPWVAAPIPLTAAVGRRRAR